MTLIDQPNPADNRNRMTIREQFHAVYTVLQEHYPELAESYAAHYPEYTTPLQTKQTLTEAAPSEPKPIIEAHNEFSRQLVEVIKNLIEEQRESYKDHIKGQRDLFERSDLTTHGAHQETVKELRSQIERLQRRDRPWIGAALAAWAITAIVIFAAIYPKLAELIGG